MNSELFALIIYFLLVSLIISFIRLLINKDKKLLYWNTVGNFAKTIAVIMFVFSLFLRLECVDSNGKFDGTCSEPITPVLIFIISPTIYIDRVIEYII